MKTYLVIIGLVLWGFQGNSQNLDFRGSTFSVGAAYLELKEDLNHGLVIRGPDLQLSYSYLVINPERYLSYRFTLGGGGKVVEGSWSGTWYLSPLSGHYAWRLGQSDKVAWYLGPKASIQYHVQNYPELHAGPILWMTSYDLGWYLSAFLQIKGRLLEFSWHNSLIGLHSRTPTQRDPYFFSTKVGENFSDIHQDLSFNTLPHFNRTELTATLYFNQETKMRSLSYQLQYLGYFPEPSFQQIFHQFCYSWYF